MDAELYVKILEEKLVEMKSLFRSTSAWSYLQDNDPKHTSKLAMTWFDHNRIFLLDYPSYSPDLNSIENIWGWIKKKLSKIRPKELEANILKLWDEISDDYLNNLVDSMPYRCQLVIANNGDKIPY